MRTADRILAHGVRPPRGTPVRLNWDQETKLLQSMIETGPALVADNVADYVRIKDANYRLEKFPSLAPAWSHYWIEYTNAGRERRGVMVRDVTSHGRGRDGSYQNAIDDARANGYDGEVKWLVDLALYVESAYHDVLGPVGWLVLVLDPMGRCQGNRWVLNRQGRPEVVDVLRNAAGEEIDMNEWLISDLVPALQTMAFLQCKNVVTDRIHPERKLSARHEKRHGHPLLRYQTVRLEVPRRGGGGTATGTGLSPSLHVVAGHFATYTPERPLFGRHVGTYWVPTHLRGDPVVGAVKTDWDLKVSS